MNGRMDECWSSKNDCDVSTSKARYVMHRNVKIFSRKISPSFIFPLVALEILDTRCLVLLDFVVYFCRYDVAQRDLFRDGTFATVGT